MFGGTDRPIGTAVRVAPDPVPHPHLSRRRDPGRRRRTSSGPGRRGRPAPRSRARGLSGALAGSGLRRRNEATAATTSRPRTATATAMKRERPSKGSGVFSSGGPGGAAGALNGHLRRRDRRGRLLDRRAGLLVPRARHGRLLRRRQRARRPPARHHGPRRDAGRGGPTGSAVTTARFWYPPRAGSYGGAQVTSTRRRWTARRVQPRVVGQRFLRDQPQGSDPDTTAAAWPVRTRTARRPARRAGRRTGRAPGSASRCVRRRGPPRTGRPPAILRATSRRGGRPAGRPGARRDGCRRPAPPPCSRPGTGPSEVVRPRAAMPRAAPGAPPPEASLAGRRSRDGTPIGRGRHGRVGRPVRPGPPSSIATTRPVTTTIGARRPRTTPRVMVGRTSALGGCPPARPNRCGWCWG